MSYSCQSGANANIRGLYLLALAGAITACARAEDERITDAVRNVNPVDAGVKHAVAPATGSTAAVVASHSAVASSSPSHAGSGSSGSPEARATGAAVANPDLPDGGKQPGSVAASGTERNPGPTPPNERADAGADAASPTVPTILESDTGAPSPDTSNDVAATPVTCVASGTLEQSNDSTACEMQLACTGKGALRTRCYPDGDNASWCDCYPNGNLNLSVQVRGGALTDVCKDSLEFCDADYHKLHGQPVATLYSHSSDEATSCSDQGTYILQSTWNAETTLGLQIEYGAYCAPDSQGRGPAGSWRCSCDFGGSQTYDWFYVLPEDLPDDMCASASSMCLHFSQLQKEPGASCVQGTLSTAEDGCRNQFSCTFPGLLDGVHITSAAAYTIACGAALVCERQPVEGAPEEAPRCVIQGPRHSVNVPLPVGATPGNACQAFDIQDMIRLGDLAPTAPPTIEWTAPFPATPSAEP